MIKVTEDAGPTIVTIMDCLQETIMKIIMGTKVGHLEEDLVTEDVVVVATVRTVV